MSSQSDSLYNLTKEKVYRSIEALVTIDGLSWDQVSDLCGYPGQNSVKNIVKNDAHNLDFIRGVRMLKTLSKHRNLRLHRETIDMTIWEINRSQQQVQATGDLEKELVTAGRAMVLADNAVRAGNTIVAIEQYREMQGVLAKMKAEINQLEAKLKKLQEG